MFLLLLFLLLTTDTFSTTTTSPITLQIGVPSPTIFLTPGAPPLTLSLPSMTTNSLVFGQTYEIRINWPATHPGKFTLWIDHDPNSSAPPIPGQSSKTALSFSPPPATTATTMRRRSLLNAHKEIFQIVRQEEKDDDVGVKEYYGHILLKKEGVSWSKTLEIRPVPFVIVLEQVHLGVLPRSTIPLVVVLILILVVGLLCIVPCFEQYIFDGGGGSGSGSGGSVRSAKQRWDVRVEIYFFI